MSAPRRRWNSRAPLMTVAVVVLLGTTLSYAGGAGSWIMNLKGLFDASNGNGNPIGGDSAGSVAANSMQGSFIETGLNWASKVGQATYKWVATDASEAGTWVESLGEAGELETFGAEAAESAAGGTIAALGWYAVGKGMQADAAHAWVIGGEVAAQCPMSDPSQQLACGTNLVMSGHLQDASYSVVGNPPGSPGMSITNGGWNGGFRNGELLTNTVNNNLNPNAPPGIPGQTNYAFPNETRSVNNQTGVITDGYVDGSTEVRTPTGVMDPGVPGVQAPQPFYAQVTTDKNGNMTTNGLWSAGYGTLTNCGGQLGGTATCTASDGSTVTLSKSVSTQLGFTQPTETVNVAGGPAPQIETSSVPIDTQLSEEPVEGMPLSVNPTAPGTALAQGSPPDPGAGGGVVTNTAAPPTTPDGAGVAPGAAPIGGTNVAAGSGQPQPGTPNPGSTTDPTSPAADVTAQITIPGCASASDPVACAQAMTSTSSCNHAVQLATAAGMDPTPFDCTRTAKVVNANQVVSAVTSVALTKAQATVGQGQIAQAASSGNQAIISQAAGNLATSGAGNMNTQATVDQAAASMDQAAAQNAQKAARLLAAATNPVTYATVSSTQPGMVMISSTDPFAKAALGLSNSGCAYGTAVQQSQVQSCITSATTYAHTAQTEEYAAMKQAGYAAAEQAGSGLTALSGAKTALSNANADNQQVTSMSTSPGSESPPDDGD